MRLMYWFLKLMLFLGKKEYVFRAADRWCDSGNLRKEMVGWQIQKDLIANYGFHRCSECGWAMHTPREHVESGSGYCYEQAFHNPKGGYVDLEEDEPILFLNSDEDEEIPRVI